MDEMERERGVVMLAEAGGRKGMEGDMMKTLIVSYHI